MSYTRVQDRVTHFGAGLAQLGLTKDSNFGIFSINRSEWVSGSWSMQNIYKWRSWVQNAGGKIVRSHL